MYEFLDDLPKNSDCKQLSKKLALKIGPELKIGDTANYIRGTENSKYHLYNIFSARVADLTGKSSEHAVYLYSIQDF